MKKLLFTLLLLHSVFTYAQPAACGDTLIDTRDGKKYRTISIGNQCWMQDNLDYGVYLTSSTFQSNNGIFERFAYNNDTTNCPIYGALYQWNEAMNYTTTVGTKGVCPTGWHLPSDAEWITLETTLGMSAGQANLNTAFRGTNQTTQLIVGGTSGFEAKYSGVFDGATQVFQGLTNYTLFWTSSLDATSGYPFRRGLYNVDPRVWRGSGNVAASPDYGYAVRCVSNTLKLTTPPDGTPNGTIRVYPIPAGEQLTIEQPSADTTINFTYQIVDTFGKIIKSELFNKTINSIDVRDIKTGIYTLKIISNTGDNVSVKKIEIIN